MHWEYKVVKMHMTESAALRTGTLNEEALNRFGEEGWEFAGIVPVLRQGWTEEVQVIFKRSIE